MALIKQIKRVWVELSILVIIGAILWCLPPLEEPGFELLLYKVLLFSASQVHALLLRKWIFGYIDFSTSFNNYHLIMVIALHMAAAYVYGIGG